MGSTVIFLDSMIAVRTIGKMKREEMGVLEDFDEFIVLLKKKIIIDVCHIYRETYFVTDMLMRFGASRADVYC